MLKHRILAIVVGIAVIIAGYFIFTTSAEQFIDYQNYRSVKQELFAQTEYQTVIPEVEIEAILRVENSQFKVSVILGQATTPLNKLKLLVVTNSSLASQSSEIFPSLGLIDQQEINLIPSGQVTDTNKTGIILSYVSNSNIAEVLVYLNYLDSNNQSVTHYLKLTPKI